MAKDKKAVVVGASEASCVVMIRVLADVLKREGHQPDVENKLGCEPCLMLGKAMQLLATYAIDLGPEDPHAVKH